MWRRRDGREYYNIPGGGHEPGERLEQTVAREIREETGLDVRVERLLWYDAKPSGSKQYYYLATYQGGEPVLGGEEIERHARGDLYHPRWVRFATLPRLRLYPSELKQHLVVGASQGFPPTPVSLAREKSTRARQSARRTARQPTPKDR